MTKKAHVRALKRRAGRNRHTMPSLKALQKLLPKAKAKQVRDLPRESRDPIPDVAPHTPRGTGCTVTSLSHGTTKSCNTNLRQTQMQQISQLIQGFGRLDCMTLAEALSFNPLLHNDQNSVRMAKISILK